jgi:TRAP-type C4-dicarboxylate transport system permease small subunit
MNNRSDGGVLQGDEGGKSLKTILDSLAKVQDRFCWWCLVVAGWMMLALSLITSYEVLSRYFFNRPTIWANDFSEYILLYSTFLASPFLLKKDEHVKLTYVTDRVGPQPRAFLQRIASIIGAAVCGVLFWRAALDTYDTFRTGATIPRPMAVPKYMVTWIISFGFLFLFLYAVRAAFAKRD